MSVFISEVKMGLKIWDFKTRADFKDISYPEVKVRR
jgi:hypothetical protein